MVYPSPLRYPGGKMKLAGFITDAIAQNGIQGGTYIEPYVGGANIALQLLFTEYVNKIVINDIDRSIYAFWHSVLNESDKLCKMIQDVQVTVEEWEKQKAVQNSKNDENLLTLGFSTFFLNRTNRSGIIKAGIIGGREQNGKWKIDARFNKVALVKRIQKIALYESRIQLYNKDAIDFVNDISSKFSDQTLIYFDPPYYNKGAALYTNYYTHDDHVNLSHYIKELKCKWILTYDYTPEIIEMYHEVEKRLLTLSYTAAEKTKGSEMLAFSENFVIPRKNYPAITIE